MLLKKGDTLILTGDSVTDCGRSRTDDPKRSSIEGFGNGYAAYTKAYLNAFYPELELNILNRGIGGNRTTDILARMEEDHLAFNPGVVSLMIGINDVWRHFDTPNGQMISAAEYRENMKKIIAGFKKSARAVVVLSPFMAETDSANPMLKMAREYAALAKEVALEAGETFVDLQAEFDRLMAKAGSYSLYSEDKVHPTPAGHMVISRAVVNALV